RSRTPVSASASSGWWSTPAACPTSATRSPTRARPATPSSDGDHRPRPVPGPVVRRLRDRRRDRVCDLLAADPGPHPRPPRGNQARARRMAVPQARGAVVAAARRLPGAPGPGPERPGHVGADLAGGDPVRPGDGRPAVAVVAGAVSAHGGQWWLATLGRHIA